ncbi:hypothetical protein BsWGS_09123 [Bradybaena similaris]
MPIEWQDSQLVSQQDYQLPILLSARGSGVCGDQPIVWRNNNMTCPERAVCGDVFVTPRTLEDGSQCEEKRTLHNCLCPGGSVCPFENPSHSLYASAQQRQYTCRNVCRLPFCENVRFTATVIAQTDVSNARNFGGRNYVRMDCRCPLHHVPYGTHRAVQATPRTGIKKNAEYICKQVENAEVIGDPCEA